MKKLQIARSMSILILFRLGRQKHSSGTIVNGVVKHFKKSFQLNASVESFEELEAARLLPSPRRSSPSERQRGPEAGGGAQPSAPTLPRERDSVKFILVICIIVSSVLKLRFLACFSIILRVFLVRLQLKSLYLFSFGIVI